MQSLRSAIFVLLTAPIIAAAGGGCRSSSPKPDSPRSQIGSPRELFERGFDRLDNESRRLAGPRGINCGRVPVNGDPKSTTRCALKAQEEERPFRVLYDLQGVDSSVTVGVVRTPEGAVCALTFDSDPSGGSGGGSRGYGIIQASRCPDPVHLSVGQDGRIDCRQKDSSPPLTSTCPNADPY